MSLGDLLICDVAMDLAICPLIHFRQSEKSINKSTNQPVNK